MENENINNDNNDNVSLDEAYQAITDIGKAGLEQIDVLNLIESDLTDINEHIANIDEYIITKEIKNEEPEEKSEEEDSEDIKKEEEISTTKQSTNEVTLDTIHQDIVTLNENVELNNLITSGQILFIGFFYYIRMYL